MDSTAPDISVIPRGHAEFEDIKIINSKNIDRTSIMKTLDKR